MKSPTDARVGIAHVWPGQVELVLRVVAMLCSIATLVSSILTLNYAEDNFFLPTTVSFFFDLLKIDDRVIGVDYETLYNNSTSAAKIGIALACFVLVYEFTLIFIRFVNIPLINTKIKIFLGIDVSATIIASVLFAVAGILAAHSASELKDILILDRLPLPEILTKTGDLLKALAGTSIIGALSLALLAAWLILILLKEWNSRIAKM